MFDPTDNPRLFAVPTGVDFCRAVMAGIDARLMGQPAHALARVDLLVANSRMQRRLQSLYIRRGPGFLPRIRPVLALADLADVDGVPPAMLPLEVRLQLAQLIARVIEADPSIAPRSALYALADSLADFMGEMVEEGVSPQDISALDIGAHAAHWERAQRFLGIAAELLDAGTRPIPEARQARIVTRLIARWQSEPPTHPVIIAGSTGSRHTTFRLMEAVARLPQGAVILPGLDRDMPADLWAGLQDTRLRELAGEDHPQFRLSRVAQAMGLGRDQIADWSTDSPSNPARNRLVSLALRPAPVTDAWRHEGPELRDLGVAVADVTLLEAPTPQAEATAIALRLRRAVDRGQKAALVTPNRTLARRVAAQLGRWNIVADDSAGLALGKTPAGRLLRQVANAMAIPGAMPSETLVALLKHPLCHSGGDRGPHLLRVRDLELQKLRRGLAFPDRTGLLAWAQKRDDDPGAAAWAEWVADTALAAPQGPEVLAFETLVQRHEGLTQRLAAGPGAPDEASGRLYDTENGAAALRLMQDLLASGAHGGPMTPRDYADFFTGLSADREARQALRPHADILIWGTQEVRVQGADLTILAGLNEGVWPAPPTPDPWLNRALRAELGLRLPDRVIGLSSHDFQQGIAGREVWLTRALRDDETDTVPARWLNRLTNLLGGASDAARDALTQMRMRGDAWITMAQSLTRPDPAAPRAPDLEPAPRPAPSPRGIKRLPEISVTELQTLRRDPYAIYAKRILDLRPLDPLRPTADARLRGTVLHRVLETFLRATSDGLRADADALFRQIAQGVLREEAPWPATQVLWMGHLDRITDWVIETEHDLRKTGAPWLIERRSGWSVPGLDLTLIGSPDRIDRLPDGRVAIYDYKSGKLPSQREIEHFDRQLQLLALMAEGGAFGDTPLEVARLGHIGLGSNLALQEAASDADFLSQTRAGLISNIARFRAEDTGFGARLAIAKTDRIGDYDHLARYGEWEDTDTPIVLPVQRCAQDNQGSDRVEAADG